MPSLNPQTLAPESTLDLGAIYTSLSLGQHTLKRSLRRLVPCKLQLGIVHPVLVDGGRPES